MEEKNKMTRKGRENLRVQDERNGGRYDDNEEV